MTVEPVDEPEVKLNVKLSADGLVAFKALNATSPSADNFTFNFTSGSSTGSTVIKDDGLGTNILSGVYNGKYTVNSPTPPVLAQVTPVPSPTKNNKPSYTFSSTQAG